MVADIRRRIDSKEITIVIYVKGYILQRTYELINRKDEVKDNINQEENEYIRKYREERCLE